MKSIIYNGGAGIVLEKLYYIVKTNALKKTFCGVNLEKNIFPSHN